MICFRKQEERQNWSRKIFFSSDWRTDAEIWGLGGDTSGSESVSKKKKSSKGNKGFFRGWVFEMKKMKFCCYVFGF